MLKWIKTPVKAILCHNKKTKKLQNTKSFQNKVMI